MSTIVLDTEKLRLSQVQLALNGWVGTSPMLSGAMSGQFADQSKINCKTAVTNEGQPLSPHRAGTTPGLRSE